MNVIKATSLALLALLVAAPAFADSRERGHDRRRDNDRGSHWTHRDRESRSAHRHRDRGDDQDWRRHRRHDSERFDPRQHWQWGFRGRPEETRRGDRHRSRWSKRYRSRPNVVIISPFGLLGQTFY